VQSAKPHNVILRWRRRLHLPSSVKEKVWKNDRRRKGKITLISSCSFLVEIVFQNYLLIGCHPWALGSTTKDACYILGFRQHLIHSDSDKMLQRQTTCVIIRKDSVGGLSVLAAVNRGEKDTLRKYLFFNVCKRPPAQLPFWVQQTLYGERDDDHDDGLGEENINKLRDGLEIERKQSIYKSAFPPMYKMQKCRESLNGTFFTFSFLSHSVKMYGTFVCHILDVT
jgi:hypothetical protein